MLLRKKLVVLFVVGALLVAAAGAVATAAQDHAKSNLVPVGSSGVHGTVHLSQVKDGTHIVVQARGLMPGERYVSLYYDNDHCALEPYSADDVIGGPYTANPAGNGHTSGVADDDLDEIDSVSVRLAGSFQLQACAKVNH